MNRTILILTAVAGLLAGCEKAGIITEPAQPIELSASGDSIVLEEKAWNGTGMKLSWTSGTNYGNGNAIDYRLEIAPEGSNWEDGWREDMGRRVYEKSWTVEEFNSFLIGTLNAAAGEESKFKARVSALVAGYEEEQTSEITFSAVTYSPVSTTLYVVGPATPGGWDINSAVEMKRTSPGVFTCTGKFNGGEFKFFTEKDFNSSYYSMDPENSCALVLNGTDDLKFEFGKAGGYTLTADLLNLSLAVAEADITTPPYDKIYFVSEANSWSFVEMTADPLNPFVFRYGAEIGNGQFKFGTSEGSWENMYKATEDNADISSTGVEFVSGFNPDNKWLVYNEDGPKAYRIALDITPDSEKMVMSGFTPYDGIWIIGDAAPYGWSLDDAATGDKATMKNSAEDPYTYTWTGDLGTGEVKFSCDLARDWNGIWIMASESDKAFGSTENEIVATVDKMLPECGAIDNKWKITLAGNYTITINALTDRMTVTKN